MFALDCEPILYTAFTIKYCGFRLFTDSLCLHNNNAVRLDEASTLLTNSMGPICWHTARIRFREKYAGGILYNIFHRRHTVQHYFPWEVREIIFVSDRTDVFCEAVQSSYRRSRSCGSVCRNVSPQTQKQTVYILVFFHFLDVTTENAWPLYKMPDLENKDLLHFKASVACALISAGSIQTPTRGSPGATPPPLKIRAVSKAPPESRFGPRKHLPLLTEAKHANRCHDAACTCKTKYICMQCLCALGALYIFV